MGSGVYLDRLKVKSGGLLTKASWRLIIELFRANLKSYDYNSFLGISWSLINPLAVLIIMYLIFSPRFGQEIRAYPLFLLVGIVCVNFFAVTTTYMMSIFSANRELVLNSTVPREGIMISALFIHSYKFLIEMVICLPLSFYYGLLNWKLLLLLPLIISYIAFVLGFCMILSLVYCFVRDIEHVWMLLMRLVYFVTPVFYSLESIPPLVREAVYFGNPLTVFVLSFQGLFMGTVDMDKYLSGLLLGCVFFIFAYCVFVALENKALERV